MSRWLPVVSIAAAVFLALPRRPRLPDPRTAPVPAGPQAGWLLRLRVLWCGLAGVAGAGFVGGPLGPAVGLAAAVAVWVIIRRAEPAHVRRDRAAVRRDLPHVVSLFASSLRAGAAPGAAIAVVCDALPGAAADRLQGVGARLALGADPARVWASLAADHELAPLGRTMARAQSTGAPVTQVVERLADELARAARADVEERARAVGVKAALPLGLCLLPAFLLLGIAPLVAGLVAALDL
ncbi:MAG: type secretion system protein [Nocardioides sp.]|nr:type secretion system protein [Nocardioides sp.]